MMMVPQESSSAVLAMIYALSQTVATQI